MTQAESTPVGGGPGGGPGRRSAAVPVLIRSARHCPELLTSAASGSLTLPRALVFFFFFGPKQSDFDKRALLFSQGCEEGSGHEGAPEHQPQQLSSSGAADPQILASSL